MSLVLVTGVAGAIGRSVVRHLAARGDTVLGIGHHAREGSAASSMNGDVSAANLERLTASHGAPQLIFHLAGGSSVGPSLAAPADDFSRTVVSTMQLLEWARRSAPEAAIVLASSAAVYGEANGSPISDRAPRAPVSPYGAHKAMMELAAESYGAGFGMKLASVRLFSVYGPGLEKQLVWEILNRLASDESQFSLKGTGAETRDWIHIDDAAQLLLAAAGQASPKAPHLNGCTGRALSVADTVRLLADGMGKNISLSFDGERRAGDPHHLVGVPSAGLETAVVPEDGLRSFARTFKRR